MKNGNKKIRLYMNKQLKKYTTILFLSATFAFAQDYNSNQSQVDDKGAEAVQAAQDSPIQAPKVKIESSSRVLKNYLKDRLKIQIRGYDSKKNRIVVIGSAGENLTPSQMQGESFVDLRSMLAVEAQLKAKAQIIESIMSKMSASQILDMPGNPIAKQLGDRKKALEAKIKAADDNVRALRGLIAQSQGALDEAIINELNGITVGDRFGALMDAIITKVDESYNKQDITDEKKAKIENIRNSLHETRSLYAAAEKEKAEVNQEAEKIHGKLKKSVKSSVEKMAEMPIFGAVVLATTESYNNKIYEVSVATAWSSKLEKASRSILLGKKENLNPKPNKKSFDEWVNSIDLSTTFGTRQYLANDGKRYYVGIVATGYDIDDYDSLDEARDFSDLFAEQECVLSLYSEMKSYKNVEKIARNVEKSDGTTETEVLKSIAKNMRSEVKDLSISGLSIVRSEDEVIHPISGKTMYVSVAAIDSDLAAKSQEFMTESYATLKELNYDQSYKEGLYSGMKDEADASKNDPNAYSKGYGEGRQGVSDSYNNRQEEPGAVKMKNLGSNSGVQSGAGVQTGSFVGGADVDDDF